MMTSVRTLILASALLASLTLMAQAAGEGPRRSWQSSVSFTPLYLGASGISGGGDYASNIYAVRLGTMGGLGPRTRIGLSFSGSYADNRFDTPTAFGAAPWGDVQRLGMAMPIMQVGSDGWRYLFTPSLDVVREEGAEPGDALIYGAVASVMKSFGQGQALGLGVGGFNQLEEVQIFPFPVIDWAFNDSWRLSNPLQAGPTGPAGLELDYRLNERWEIGFGGAYRQLRFRLREGGAVSGGVGAESGLVAFIHAAVKAGERLSLDLYGGALLQGELRVEDRHGDTVVNRGLETAPLLGATVKLAY
jgi:hypothetical protein